MLVAYASVGCTCVHAVTQNLRIEVGEIEELGGCFRHRHPRGRGAADAATGGRGGDRVVGHAAVQGERERLLLLAAPLQPKAAIQPEAPFQPALPPRDGAACKGA